jgi:hypothetical protein
MVEGDGPRRYDLGKLGMVADYADVFGQGLTRTVTPEQLKQAVVLARDEDGNPSSLWLRREPGVHPVGRGNLGETLPETS